MSPSSEVLRLLDIITDLDTLMARGDGQEVALSDHMRQSIQQARLVLIKRLITAHLGGRAEPMTSRSLTKVAKTLVEVADDSGLTAPEANALAVCQGALLTRLRTVHPNGDLVAELLPHLRIATQPASVEQPVEPEEPPAPPPPDQSEPPPPPPPADPPRPRGIMTNPNPINAEGLDRYAFGGRPAQEPIDLAPFWISRPQIEGSERAKPGFIERLRQAVRRYPLEWDTYGAPTPA